MSETTTNGQREEAILEALRQLAEPMRATTARAAVFWMIDVEDVPIARVREFVQHLLSVEALKPVADAAFVTGLAAALGMVAEFEKAVDDGAY
jgi:hypothetical protein